MQERISIKFNNFLKISNRRESIFLKKRCRGIYRNSNKEHQKNIIFKNIHWSTTETIKNQL